MLRGGRIHILLSHPRRSNSGNPTSRLNLDAGRFGHNGKESGWHSGHQIYCVVGVWFYHFDISRTLTPMPSAYDCHGRSDLRPWNLKQRSANLWATGNF